MKRLGIMIKLSNLILQIWHYFQIKLVGFLFEIIIGFIGGGGEID